MSNAAGTRVSDPGWLRSEHYDLTLIRDVTLIALVSGLVVALNPALFLFVIIAYLLGSVRVASRTYRSPSATAPHESSGVENRGPPVG